ncbi:MAG: penicillin-binding protein [bacterium]
MKSNQISASRIVLLMGIATLVYAGLVINLFFLQVVHAPDVIARSGRARTFHLPLPPTRGLLLDRNGKALAQNDILYTAVADKTHIQNVTATLEQVGGMLSLSPAEIQRHISFLLKEKVKARELKQNLTEEDKERIEAAGISGIEFHEQPIRFYPEGTLAAHVVGYTGADNAGLAGLEFSLNEKLKGMPQVIEADKDIRRRPIADTDYTKAMIRGADYVLTIDSYIQYIVERELKKVCEETNAVQADAVVIHPHSGEILALANYPTYDPNDYQNYSEDYRKNRLLTDVFEPGSVMKPFTIAAALDQGVVTPGTRFYCENGSFYFKGRTIRDDIHRFDTLSVHDILVYSSNIGTIKITQRLGSHPDDFRGQARVLYDYLTRFGFRNGGEATTLLPGESGGILRPPQQWQPASIGSIPYGQEIATNTLILTAAYGALANRGLYQKPSILRGYQVMDRYFYPREPVPPYRIISEQTADALIKMMIDVTENPEGTGRYVRIPGFHIAGKTGTAQKTDPRTGAYARGKRIASFAGFFPAENPEAVIVVVVDEPKKKKYGGETAGPVWKTIAEEIIAYWGLSPTYKEDPLLVQAAAKAQAEIQSATSVSGPGDSKPFLSFGVTRQLPVPPAPVWTPGNGTMPDLVGLSIREAYVRLAVNGLKADIQGTGKVVKQPIPPGTPLNGLKKIGVVECEPALTDPGILPTPEMVVTR